MDELDAADLVDAELVVGTVGNDGLARAQLELFTIDRDRHIFGIERDRSAMRVTSSKGARQDRAAFSHVADVVVGRQTLRVEQRRRLLGRIDRLA